MNNSERGARVTDPHGHDEERLIGSETGLAAIMDILRAVSKTTLPVLLLGESGTGKATIARWLHRQSFHRSGPLREVRCGGISAASVDRELLGAELRVTGEADVARPGCFEQADGGTLFLDDVDQLTPEAQARLIQIIRSGEIVRVGGSRPMRVNVRLIASTTRDLRTLADTQAFRDDLYYRLAGFPIVIPPLRDRLVDVPAFAEHLAARAATRLALRSVPLDIEQIKALADHSWPGNLDEMGAIIDRAVLLGRGQVLDVRAALAEQRAVRPRGL